MRQTTDNAALLGRLEQIFKKDSRQWSVSPTVFRMQKLATTNSSFQRLR